MFVGHVAVAILLVAIVPGVSPGAALLGVSFPDLLFAVLVLLGIEDVRPDSDSPRFRDVDFRSFPYSHSLVLGTAFAFVPAVIVGVAWDPLAGAVFVIGAISHWLLDVLVHPPHVPLLGVGEDRHVGLDLWSRPWAAFVVELALVVGAAFVFLPPDSRLAAIAIAVVLHLAMADAILGVTTITPLSTPTRFAGGIIGGYAVLISAFWWVL